MWPHLSTSTFLDSLMIEKKKKKKKAEPRKASIPTVSVTEPLNVNPIKIMLKPKAS